MGSSFVGLFKRGTSLSENSVRVKTGGFGVEGAKHVRFPGEETRSDSSFAPLLIGRKGNPMMRVRARSVVDPMLKHRATKSAGLAPSTPHPRTLARVPVKGRSFGSLVPGKPARRRTSNRTTAAAAARLSERTSGRVGMR